MKEKKILGPVQRKQKALSNMNYFNVKTLPRKKPSLGLCLQTSHCRHWRFDGSFTLGFPAPPCTSALQYRPACVAFKPKRSLKLNLARAAQPCWETPWVTAREVNTVGALCHGAGWFGTPSKPAGQKDHRSAHDQQTYLSDYFWERLFERRSGFTRGVQQSTAGLKTALLSPSPPLERGPERRK